MTARSMTFCNSRMFRLSAAFCEAGDEILQKQRAESIVAQH